MGIKLKIKDWVQARGKIAGEIKKRGGSFTGNEQHGQFKVPVLVSGIAGKYRALKTEGDYTDIEITIVDKPLGVPETQIKSELKNYAKIYI